MESTKNKKKEGLLSGLLPAIGTLHLAAMGVMLCIGLTAGMLIHISAISSSVEWALFFFFTVFLISSGVLLKKPYVLIEEKFYDYLQQIENEAKNGRYQLENFHQSDTLEKVLLSRSERIIKTILYYLVGAYTVIIIVLMEKSLTNVILYIPLLGNTNITTIAVYSIVPILIWLWRRARYDGFAEGYLMGYIEAFKKVESWETELDKRL